MNKFSASVHQTTISINILNHFSFILQQWKLINEQTVFIEIIIVKVKGKKNLMQNRISMFVMFERYCIVITSKSVSYI